MTLAPAVAQTQFGGEVGVYFDEVGNETVRDSLVAGAVTKIFVVGFGLEEIQGYEFMMTPSVAPAFFLGKSLYGPDPIDTGNDYEVLARLAECESNPSAMGASAESWTLARYEFLYAAPVSPAYFCLEPAPSTGAVAPEFVVCGPSETRLGLSLHSPDPSGSVPGGCAAVDPEICDFPPREFFTFRVWPGEAEVTTEQDFSLEVEGVPWVWICKTAKPPYLEKDPSLVFASLHLAWDRSLAEITEVRIGPPGMDWRLTWVADDTGVQITLESGTHALTTDTSPEPLLWLDLRSGSATGHTEVAVDSGVARYSDGFEVAVEGFSPGSIDVGIVPSPVDSWGTLKSQFGSASTH
jgi:hypothetical protein